MQEQSRGVGHRVGAPLGLVTGGHFFSHLYLLALPPLLPLIVAAFSLSNATFGVLVSAVALGPLFLQIPVGSIVDDRGPKTVLVAGLLVSGLGTALVGVAPTYPVAVGFAVLAGVGQAAFHPADYAILGSITSESNEGRAFSIHTFGGYAGFAAAPIGIGTLGFATSWRFALVVAGLLGVVYALVVAVALDAAAFVRPGDDDAEEGRTSGGRVRSMLAGAFHPPVLAMFAFFMVITMGTKAIQTFTTVFITDGFGLTADLGNGSLTSFFASTAVGILVGGVLADRFHPQTVAVSTLTVVAATVLAVVAGAVPVTATTVVPLYAILGFFVGVALPSRDRLVSAFSDPNDVGSNFGFVFTGLSLGGLLSPVLVGVTIDATSVYVGLLFVAAFYALAAFVVVTLALGVVPTGNRSG